MNSSNCDQSMAGIVVRNFCISLLVASVFLPGCSCTPKKEDPISLGRARSGRTGDGVGEGDGNGNGNGGIGNGNGAESGNGSGDGDGDGSGGGGESEGTQGSGEHADGDTASRSQDGAAAGQAAAGASRAFQVGGLPDRPSACRPHRFPHEEPPPHRPR